MHAGMCIAPHPHPLSQAATTTGEPACIGGPAPARHGHHTTRPGATCAPLRRWVLQVSGNTVLGTWGATPAPLMIRGSTYVNAHLYVAGGSTMQYLLATVSGNGERPARGLLSQAMRAHAGSASGP